jgi:hypothetical protein
LTQLGGVAGVSAGESDGVRPRNTRHNECAYIVRYRRILRDLPTGCRYRKYYHCSGLLRCDTEIRGRKDEERLGGWGEMLERWATTLILSHPSTRFPANQGTGSATATHLCLCLTRLGFGEARPSRPRVSRREGQVVVHSQSFSSCPPSRHPSPAPTHALALGSALSSCKKARLMQSDTVGSP